MTHSTFMHQADDSNTTNRIQSQSELHPREDLVDYAKQYAREKPEVVAMWCFGIGFIVGWKLKPW